MIVRKYAPAAVCAALLAAPGLAYGQQTDADGYLVFGSHEEIVEAARAESGTLSVYMSYQQGIVEQIVDLFNSTYDFVNAVGQEVGDADARILLELQAGVNDGDVVHIEGDELGFENYYPVLLPLNLRSMSDNGVLDIPEEMINPNEPIMAAFGSALGGVPYNTETLPEHLVPQSYEDLLHPDLRDSGLLWVDVANIQGLAALFAVWGEDEVVDFAARLGEQNPVWTTGTTRSLTAMAAGEFAIGSLSLYHSAVRLQRGNAPHIEVLLFEPVPVRLTQVLGVNETTRMPATATLFLEFMASLEVQNYLNETGPVIGSPFREGSETARLTEGKEIAFVGWDDLERMDAIQQRIIEAWGFPVAVP